MVSCFLHPHEKDVGSDEGAHRDVVHWAEEQVSVGVVVDLGFSLEHHSLIIERFDDFGLLLIGEKNTGRSELTMDFDKPLFFVL